MVTAKGQYATVPSTPKKTWRNSLPMDMLLSAVSVVVVARPSSEVPEGLMKYPVFLCDPRGFVDSYKRRGVQQKFAITLHIHFLKFQ